MRANSLWLAALLLLAPPVGAETWVSGSASVRAGPSLLQDASEHETSTSVHVVNSWTYAPGDTFFGLSPNGAAAGYGIVDYGYAKIGVGGSAADATTIALASMAASFADQFSILGGSQYAGQMGTLTISIAFDYRAIASQTAFGGAMVDIQQQLHVLSSAGAVDVQQRLLNYSGEGGTNINYRYVGFTTPTGGGQLDLPFATEYSVVVPFMFDQAVSITNLFVVNGGASGNNVDQTAHSGLFDIDAFNSYYWGGMEVRDATGALVFAELVSDSGTDWRQSFIPTTTAIPEPATAAMVALSLLGLGWRARRKPIVALTC
jgi:hypothetical protein